MKNKKLSKKQKILISIILIIIIIILSILIIYFINNNHSDYLDSNKSALMVEEDEDGMLHNTSPEISKDKIFENLLFSNIQLLSLDTTNVFTADVTNNSGKDLSSQERTLTFFNYLNNEIFQLKIYIPEVKNGETVPIRTQTNDFIVDAYDFKLD